MTVSRGKVHKYLGMTLGYTVRGQVQIKMIDFLYEVLIAFDGTDREIVTTRIDNGPRASTKKR